MAIAFVNGAVAGSNAGVSTLTVNYSPTPGNVVCVFLSVNGVITTPTVTDSNSNLLSAGATASNTNGLLCFFYTASSGVTSFIANWTSARTCNMAVVEYSGASSINGALAGNSAVGTSTTASITVTTQDNNDWVVGAAVCASQNLTVTVGNSREVEAVATGPRLTVLDNTVATAGSVSLTGTLTSAAWGMVLIELRTAGASVAGSNWLSKAVATGVNKH